MDGRGGPDMANNSRKTGGRAFQPSLDGTLEPRLLLTRGVHSLGVYPTISTQTGAAGLIARIILKNGEGFEVITTRGTVKAVANNKTNQVNLILSGTTEDTEVLINPITPYIRRGVAHKFAPSAGTRTGVVQIGDIIVQSGTVGTILGYNTAVLNGKLSIPSANRVDRIAFQSLAPGAAITTGGDLEDLDIRQGINLSGANSFIHVGRDLNLFSVANNVVLTNGATISTGRFLGLTIQPPRGTGPSGQGLVFMGNLSIDPSSAVHFGALGVTSIINGSGSGISRLTVGSPNGNTIIFEGGFTL